MTAGEDEMVPERLERIEGSVNHLVTRVTVLEEKLDAHGRRFDGQLQELTQSVDARFQELTQRVDAQGRRFDVQMEGLRETITTFAENIGGRLDAISEQMTNSQKITDARFSDHQAVLRDHSRRITDLERRPRRRT